MKSIILSVVSIIIALIYFLHALRCVNWHNGTDDWVRIETAVRRVSFSGECFGINALDFIIFLPLSLAFCAASMLTSTSSTDLSLLVFTAEISCAFYLAAKIISGQKAAAAAAQVLFLCEIYPGFDSVFEALQILSFMLVIMLMFVYITRPYNKMFTSALPALFFAGFFAGFGCMAYCLPAMIFVYIIACVLKFRSDREDYLQPQPIRAVIFAFIAFVLLPIVGSVLFAAVQCYYPGGNEPGSLPELLSVAATAIIARDYVFISPITFAVGLSSVALCAYCFAKFKSGTGLMIIIFSVFCIGAVVALGNCLMLVPILSMAMASMFKFTGRHRTSGIVCPISACVIFIALKAAEIIF